MTQHGSSTNANFAKHPGNGGFRTTRWSVVARAGDECERALEDLCGDYWFPLYAYARRRMDLEKAQDMTQEFFAVLLDKNYVESADREKGKFRAFLLTAFKNFMANQHDRENAIKRGGGVRKFSLDFENADSKYSMHPADDLTPEKVFERQWVMTLLENVVTRVKNDLAKKGEYHLERFELLKHHVLGKPGGDYAEIGKQLNMTPETLRVHVFRLRQKYRDTLRDEIAGTVGDSEDIDDEIMRLFEILG